MKMDTYQKNKTIEDVKIGDEVQEKRTITESDVIAFSELSGDKAPQHLDKEYAGSTRYAGRIVHGMLTASIVCSPLTKLVAPGGISIENNFKYKAPVYIGDTITATARVVEKINEKRIIKAELICINQNNKVVLEGWGLELMAIEKP
jgi:3-hydroxybutyryl-CoA dehydratase